MLAHACMHTHPVTARLDDGRRGRGARSRRDGDLLATVVGGKDTAGNADDHFGVGVDVASSAVRAAADVNTVRLHVHPHTLTKLWCRQSRCSWQCHCARPVAS